MNEPTQEDFQTAVKVIRYVQQNIRDAQRDHMQNHKDRHVREYGKVFTGIYEGFLQKRYKQAGVTAEFIEDEFLTED